MDGSGVGQENLFNVLKAYSLLVFHLRLIILIHHCLQLRYVSWILSRFTVFDCNSSAHSKFCLHYAMVPHRTFKMPDEEAFGELVRLMWTYDLRGHFLPEMPKLQLRLVCNFLSSFTSYCHSRSLLNAVPSMMLSLIRLSFDIDKVLFSLSDWWRRCYLSSTSTSFDKVSNRVCLLRSGS